MEADIMNVNIERYCTVEQSIIGSCKEIKEIRKGTKPKKSWDSFVAEKSKDNKTQKG